jgi:hypothetical protein
MLDLLPSPEGSLAFVAFGSTDTSVLEGELDRGSGPRSRAAPACVQPITALNGDCLSDYFGADEVSPSDFAQFWISSPDMR